MSVIENRLSFCLYLNAISTTLSKLPNRPRLAQNDGPICGSAAGRSSTQIRLTVAIDPAKLGTTKQARADDSHSAQLHASGSLTHYSAADSLREGVGGTMYILRIEHSIPD